MKRVIAIGETLIDFVPQQKGCALREVTHFERVAGGAPANVAIAVSRLGGDAAMISQVGKDAFGEHILDVLSSDGVDTSYVFQTDRANTGLAFVSLDSTGNREFSFFRNPSADLFLSPEQITPAMLTDCAALHFCSVDLVDWPVRKAHEKAIALAREGNTIVSFDPNVRLPLWPSAAACRQAIQDFLPLAHMVKLSDNEVEFVTGCADERAAAEKLLAGDCRLVLVTKGPDGASAYTRTSEAHVPSLPGEIVDTTGAGDSFIGSFLFQIARDRVSRDALGALDGDTLERYLTFCARCAAFTCAHKGAVMARQADLAAQA